MSPRRLHSASGNDKRAGGIKEEVEVLWAVRSHKSCLRNRRCRKCIPVVITSHLKGIFIDCVGGKINLAALCEETDTSALFGFGTGEATLQGTAQHK